jgi:hypothetical protein
LHDKKTWFLAGFQQNNNFGGHLQNPYPGKIKKVFEENETDVCFQATFKNRIGTTIFIQIILNFLSMEPAKILRVLFIIHHSPTL